LQAFDQAHVQESELLDQEKMNQPYNADLMAGRPPAKEAPIFGQRLVASVLCALRIEHAAPLTRQIQMSPASVLSRRSTR
jgi:hypothetical protein